MTLQLLDFLTFWLLERLTWFLLDVIILYFVTSRFHELLTLWLHDFAASRLPILRLDDSLSSKTLDISIPLLFDTQLSGSCIPQLFDSLTYAFFFIVTFWRSSFLTFWRFDFSTFAFLNSGFIDCLNASFLDYLIPFLLDCFFASLLDYLNPPLLDCLIVGLLYRLTVCMLIDCLTAWFLDCSKSTQIQLGLFVR